MVQETKANAEVGASSKVGGGDDGEQAKISGDAKVTVLQAVS